MIYNGIKYKSQRACCIAIGVSPDTIYSRMKRDGMSFKKAVEHRPRAKAKDILESSKTAWPINNHLGGFLLSSKLMSIPFIKWPELI